MALSPRANSVWKSYRYPDHGYVAPAIAGGETPDVLPVLQSLLLKKVSPQTQHQEVILCWHHIMELHCNLASKHSDHRSWPGRQEVDRYNEVVMEKSIPAHQRFYCVLPECAKACCVKRRSPSRACPYCNTMVAPSPLCEEGMKCSLLPVWSYLSHAADDNTELWRL